MGNVHRRASGAAARRKILRVPKSEWIFMRVVPVRTKTFSIRRLDGDRFGCGATLTRGSGVPGRQPTDPTRITGWRNFLFRSLRGGVTHSATEAYWLAASYSMGSVKLMRADETQL